MIMHYLTKQLVQKTKNDPHKFLSFLIIFFLKLLTIN